MKILVTGNAGSGKSTVSNQIAQILGMNVIGLDGVVWKPGWTKAPNAERKSQELKIANQPNWIVDGVSHVIQEHADLVIFLDTPRWKSYLRCTRRNSKFLFRSRPGLPADCPEILIIPKLAKIIWQFPERTEPKILEQTLRNSTEQRFEHIRTNTELQCVLSNLSKCTNSSLSTNEE